MEKRKRKRREEEGERRKRGDVEKGRENRVKKGGKNSRIRR